MRAFLLGYPGVTAIGELITPFIGPGQVWVIARIDIDNEIRGNQVKSLVRSIESDMHQQSANIYRVDVVPTGGGPWGTTAPSMRCSHTAGDVGDLKSRLYEMFITKAMRGVASTVR